jgi:uncharacterized protein YndB with AHSA1/START domain
MIKTMNVELVIKRTFNAPQEQVFGAWTQAESLEKWWGPKGCAITVIGLDFIPGGFFHYRMDMPDGGVMWGKFIFREIEAPERIVFLNSFSDENANITRAPFDTPFPLQMLLKVIFTEHEGGTLLTLHGSPYNATTEEAKAFGDLHESMHQGFGGTFDQLDEFLKRAEGGN